jgi:diguanylate cyclase
MSLPHRLARWLSMLTLLALASFAAQAMQTAEPLRLADGEPSIDLWPAVTVLSDPEHALDERSVLTRLADFRAPQSPHANLGVRRDTVWLRVPLAVPASERGRWVLDIDYASLDSIDVFVISDGVATQHHRLGDERLFAERPLPSNTHAVALAFERGTEQELLLRVRSTSSMIVPLRLVGEVRFQAEQARVQMAQGLLAGLGLALTLYSLVHAVMLRSAMFANYALTVASTTLFFYALYGLAPQHLWPTHEGLTRNAAPVLVLLAIVGGLRFVGVAMQVRELSRAIHAAQTVVWVAALVSAAAFVLGFIEYRSAQAAGTWLGVACMLVSLPAALLRARHGDRAAWVVTAGWGLYACGAFTMALLLRGRLPFNVWTEYAFQIGSAIEMLSWLVVLGMRTEEVRQSAHRSHAERDVMRSLAETDALTGLPNRRGLRQRLEASLPACAPGRLGALFMVDLDGFKAVNDRLGHDAGDLLLKAVAERLRGLVRGGDTVARLGGDEFVICADALPDPAAAHRLGEKFVQAFRAPFSIDGQSCQVGLTVGYALSPLDGSDADALLKRADAALYAGKAAGKGRVLGAHQMRADSEGFRADVAAELAGQRRAAPKRPAALQAAALRDATPPRAVQAREGGLGAAALGPSGDANEVSKGPSVSVSR